MKNELVDILFEQGFINEQERYALKEQSYFNSDNRYIWATSDGVLFRRGKYRAPFLSIARVGDKLRIDIIEEGKILASGSVGY